MFKPGSVEQLASVGDDQSLLFWDTRTAKGPPSLRVDEAHGKGEDVQCVDWASEVSREIDQGSLVCWLVGLGDGGEPPPGDQGRGH